MEESIDCIENGKHKPNLIYYDSAAKYWSQIPPTIEGMLGGFGFISRTDIKGSQCFLKHLFKMSDPPGRNRAADCGAGIGRVTKNLLIKFFNQVDLVEQNPTFLEEAKSFIGAKNKTVNCFNVGLQDFSPELDTYDVIWSQWVLGHLTDEDLVTFFKSCKRGLRPGGVIVVKENLTSSDRVEVDDQDSSVTRPPALFTELYERAGLRCIHRQTQTNFPKGIYQVVMFAFRPVELRGSDFGTLAPDTQRVHPTGISLAEDVQQEHPTGVPLAEDHLQEHPTGMPLEENMLQEHPTGITLTEDVLQEYPTGIPLKDVLQEYQTGMPLEKDMLQEHPTEILLVEEKRQETSAVPRGMLPAEAMQQECPTRTPLAEGIQVEQPTGMILTEHMQQECPIGMVLTEDMQQECPMLPTEGTQRQLETLPVERTQQKCERAS